MYYMNYFFLFSIIGHILESFFYVNGGESGILYGPYTPVYGIGVCLIILVFNYLNKKKVSSKLTILCTFLFGFIGLSLIELLGGVLIEKIFNVVFWDYSNLKFHIGHYIALEIGLIWGISSLIIAYIIKPFFDKFITKIPKIFTWIFILIFIADLFITLFTKVLF